MNLIPSAFTITGYLCNFPDAANNPYAPVLFYTDLSGNITAGLLGSQANPGVRWPIYQMGAAPSSVTYLTISTPLGQYQIYFSPGDGSTIPTSVLLQNITSSQPYPTNQRVLWAAPTPTPAVTSGKFILRIDATQWAANADGISLTAC